MAKKTAGGEGSGKVISARLPDAALHLKGRQYALAAGVSFGELVALALTEYMKNNPIKK